MIPPKRHQEICAGDILSYKISIANNQWQVENLHINFSCYTIKK